MEKNNSESRKSSLLWNIIAAAALFLAIIIVIQILLKVGTQHNKEIEVPDFSTMNIADAEDLAKSSHVKIEVTDSVFTHSMARGCIFSQTPTPGSKVKKGRRILITINALSPKMVEVPSLVGYSLRQAQTELLSRGLTVGKLSYISDMASNNVLAQTMNGKSVRPGTKVEIETRIDLTLGLNEADAVTKIPHLTGYTMKVAVDNIIEHSLNLGRVRFDETVNNWVDSANAVVYRQEPAYSNENSYPMGASVNIYLTLDKNKVK